MTALDIFKQQVEAFIEHTGITATQFGKTAVGDGMFIFKMRKGRIPNINTAEKVGQFMRKQLDNRMLEFAIRAKRDL